jgi:hypothetical protein
MENCEEEIKEEKERERGEQILCNTNICTLWGIQWILREREGG